jgi:uncharacterized protein
MIELNPIDDGIGLNIRVHPGARHNAITGTHAGALKVSVTQAAEKGKANKAVIRVLCEQLKLRPNQIELQSGVTSAQKRFIIREVPLVELQQRIAAALE